MRRSDESHAPAIRHEASVAERDRVAADIREKLAGDAETAWPVRGRAAVGAAVPGGRERYKTNCVMVVNEMRMALRELGRRLVERGVIDDVEQVFMLTDAELDAVRQHPERFRDVLADRWRRTGRCSTTSRRSSSTDASPALERDDPPRPPGRREGRSRHGAHGSGRLGRRRHRAGPRRPRRRRPRRLEPGDVLVAPQTDPAWVPLFVPAAAVVVNVGAMGSHAMIVSRELGIPCVVSVADATGTHPRRRDGHRRRQRRHGHRVVGLGMGFASLARASLLRLGRWRFPRRQRGVSLGRNSLTPTRPAPRVRA